MKGKRIEIYQSLHSFNLKFLPPFLSVQHLQQHNELHAMGSTTDAASPQSRRTTIKCQTQVQTQAHTCEPSAQCPVPSAQSGWLAKVSPAGQLQQSSRFVTHVIMVAGSGSGASPKWRAAERARESEGGGDSSLIVVA